jgi:opacity protein-like surface antigen
MMRHLRMLGLISVAMLALFTAPAMVSAQTPTQDQYEPAPGSDNEPDNSGGGTNPTDDAGNAGVDVNAADTNGKLPFTGGSVPTVVVIGLALLAAGLLGTVATRKRSSAAA